VRYRTSSLALAFVSLGAAAAACGDHDGPPAAVQACAVEPVQTFHERIEPLLSDSRASTCNQCHLSGVDLSVFARDTPCKTWACLVEQDLVNVRSPEDSKILGWIDRAKPDSDLITPQVIQAEHDAFRDWIEANAACPNACAGVTCGAPDQGPTCPVPKERPSDAPPEIPSDDCSPRQLEQAFYDDVYAWRSRCFPCHFDTELNADPNAPRWLSATGNCQTGSAVTFQRVRDLGLIDVGDPEKSLLLQKPLDEAAGGVKHGGGEKFPDTTDATYQSFLRFIQHYQHCQQQ